ncbi:MAG: TRAP transporter substrate-binding protein DctP [Archangiaceae bacterium]|nr:TRAP transporter substrate-binding protein DctP [Archangiaceae bacterium]
MLTALVVLTTLSAEPQTIKLGSLAPRESPWGQVLRVWAKAVKEKTQGQVALDFYWNATQGDEAAQMGKVKSGQLDGAVVTAVGLGSIDHDVNVLQIPGLIQDWATLDKVREGLKTHFDDSFHKAGIELVGWGDVGIDYLFSKGFAIHLPADLKGKKPWVWREDPVIPPFFQSAASGVVLVPTGVPEALPELTTGNANVMVTSALAAEQLQWSSRLDNVNLIVTSPNVGGIVISQAALAKLKPEHKAIVLDTGRFACKALSDRIRGEDAQALERIKKRMAVVEPTEAEKAEWAKVFKATREKLVKGTFKPELVKKVEELIAK